MVIFCTCKLCSILFRNTCLWDDRMHLGKLKSLLSCDNNTFTLTSQENIIWRLKTIIVFIGYLDMLITRWWLDIMHNISKDVRLTALKLLIHINDFTLYFLARVTLAVPNWQAVSKSNWQIDMMVYLLHSNNMLSAHELPTLCFYWEHNLCQKQLDSWILTNLKNILVVSVMWKMKSSLEYWSLEPLKVFFFFALPHNISSISNSWSSPFKTLPYQQKSITDCIEIRDNTLYVLCDTSLVI